MRSTCTKTAPPSSCFNSLGALPHCVRMIQERVFAFIQISPMEHPPTETHQQSHIHNQKCLKITILNSLEVSKKMLFPFGGFRVNVVNSWWSLDGCC